MVSGLKLLTANALAQGLGTVIALLFTIIGARGMSVFEYGELRTAMTLLPLLMIITLPGFDTLILKQTSQKRPIPLRRILYVRMGLGLCAGLLLLAATLFWRSHLSSPLFFFFISTALLLPFYEVASGYRNTLLGYKRPLRGTQLLLQARLLCLLLFLTFSAIIYSTKLSFLWVYPAWMLAAIIPGFWNYLRLLIPRGRRFRVQRGSANILAAITITSAGFIYTLAYSIDKLWVRHELGAEQLALYALLIMIPQELAKIFDTSLHLFYRHLFFNAQLNRTKLGLLALLLSPPLMLAYAIGFYFLSPLLFGPAYSYSFLTVLASSLLIPGLALEHAATHHFLTRHGERGMFLYTTSNLVLTALAVPIGTAQGGLTGLLLALAIKQFALPVLLMLYHRSRHDLHPQPSA